MLPDSSAWLHHYLTIGSLGLPDRSSNQIPDPTYILRYTMTELLINTLAGEKHSIFLHNVSFGYYCLLYFSFLPGLTFRRPYSEHDQIWSIIHVAPLVGITRKRLGGLT